MSIVTPGQKALDQCIDRKYTVIIPRDFIQHCVESSRDAIIDQDALSSGDTYHVVNDVVVERLESDLIDNIQGELQDFITNITISLAEQLAEEES